MIKKLNPKFSFIVRNQIVCMPINESITKEKSAKFTNISDVDRIFQNITRFNEFQTIQNEDLFGPLRNDSVIVIVQVK